MASLPGLVALVALVFTWVSVGQTGTELRIAEQGQITSRFNQAVANLGSKSLDVRFGGIYALERIMQDSARDQPRIISVLSAYVRTHTPVPTDGFPKMKRDDAAPPLDADVVAVTEVLAARPSGHDGHAEINWQSADLRGVYLQTRYGTTSEDEPSAPRYLPFGFANLAEADLRLAYFFGVDLHDAWCAGANLAYAELSDVNLTNAQMPWADLTGVVLKETSLQGADLSNAILVDAELIRADLRDAVLDEADLRGADLYRANLRGADLGGSDLRRANLTGADLTGADLTAARLDGAKGVPAEVLDR
ncbi:pentapeptide repeat-containing protein [Streptomyces erythrochromogenes]|uniref:pentapeptide repeat-containing protein n=1 Tax=Streptomyces erythrochromogenes TaxID=285574 RepID=UPI0036CB8FBC